MAPHVHEQLYRRALSKHSSQDKNNNIVPVVHGQRAVCIITGHEFPWGVQNTESLLHESWIIPTGKGTRVYCSMPSTQSSMMHVEIYEQAMYKRIERAIKDGNDTLANDLKNQMIRAIDYFEHNMRYIHFHPSDEIEIEEDE